MSQSAQILSRYQIDITEPDGRVKISMDYFSLNFGFRSADLNNLLSLRLAPNVSTSLLERISELHLAQRGIDSGSAEMKYLETSSKLALYGLHQFHVRDAEKVDIILGVHHGGVFIFEKGRRHANTLKRTKYFWRVRLRGRL